MSVLTHRAEQHGNSFLVGVKHIAWNYSWACHIFSSPAFYGNAPMGQTFAKIFCEVPRNQWLLRRISNATLGQGQDSGRSFIFSFITPQWPLTYYCVFFLSSRPPPQWLKISLILCRGDVSCNGRPQFSVRDDTDGAERMNFIQAAVGLATKQAVV